MSYRFVGILSVVLMVVPFIGIPSVWKMWIVFGIGAVLFIHMVTRIIYS